MVGSQTKKSSSKKKSPKQRSIWSKTKRMFTGSPQKPTTTTFVSSSKIFISGSNLEPRKGLLTSGLFSTGLMTLGDGTVFTIGFFGVEKLHDAVYDPYYYMVLKWSPGDIIEYTYIGGLGNALITGTLWEIKNVTKNQIVKGNKLWTLDGKEGR